MRGIDVINCVATGKRQHIISDHQVNLVDRISLGIFFQLFQSQSQTGATSAKAFKDDPQHLVRVLLEDFLEFFSRCFGDRQHAISSP